MHVDPVRPLLSSDDPCSARRRVSAGPASRAAPYPSGHWGDLFTRGGGRGIFGRAAVRWPIRERPHPRLLNPSVAAPPTIRPATIADAEPLAELFTALEHPTSADAIRARWAGWEAAGAGAFVAEAEDGTLVGAVTLHRMLVLHRPHAVGRITALVVAPAVRGQGIGRALVTAAERAHRAAGCGLLEITSNLRRVDAHAFYERIGYARTSYRFMKPLAESTQEATHGTP